MKEKTILKELKNRGWNMQFDAREKHLIKEIAEITEKQTFSEMQKIKVIDLENVNRLVVVHWVKPSKMGMKGTGRVIDQWNAHVELSLQDEGRTLKVFYGENK